MKTENKFVLLKRKFNSRSHAAQELNKMEAEGKITNYRIAWNTQLKMTVEVVYATS